MDKRINHIVQKLRQAKQIAQTTEVGKLFLTPIPSALPLETYIGRLLRETRVSTDTLVIALLWLQDLPITDWTVHRLFLVALVVAIKYNEDDYFINTDYAEIGGVSLGELNRMEAEFLHNLKQWRLFIDTTEDPTYKQLYLQMLLG